MGDRQNAESVMIEPNDHLQAIRRSSERMPERQGRARMDMNERVTPFEPEVQARLLAQIRPEMLCHYPDPSPLYERLARHLQFPEEWLYVTNGSDAAIRMLFQAYIRPGDRVVFPEPTFAMYGVYSQLFRAQAHTVPYLRGKPLDAAALQARIGAGARILAVANPDQPTGSVVSRHTLTELAAAARKAGTLFIVDEAYYPFYPETAVELVREYDNVVVLRTFSKVGGIAGLRVGYLVANPAIVDSVSRVRGSFEVNTIAIAIASFLLDNPALTREFLQEVEAGREVLRQMATRLGIGFPACPANFQLLQFAGASSTARLAVQLAARGYLVKGGFSAPAVSDCIRVTLAGPELMTRFCTECEDVFRSFAAEWG
jgi:histidinol-phosphate aminotransferase